MYLFLLFNPYQPFKIQVKFDFFLVCLQTCLVLSEFSVTLYFYRNY